MKICIVTANLGGFDKQVDPVNPQALPKDVEELRFHRFTDEDFPPRFNSMTPRLQARIPKMFAWQMLPGYDYYLWFDASCTLPKSDSVLWFLKQIEGADIAVFKHPNRETVQQEADYLKERLELERTGQKQPYVLPRYENERIDDQLAVVDPQAMLYASTAFIYKDTQAARDLLTIWWLHTSLYHSIDQLSLPTAIQHSGATVNVIQENYMDCEYLKYVR